MKNEHNGFDVKNVVTINLTLRTRVLTTALHIIKTVDKIQW